MTPRLAATLADTRHLLDTLSGDLRALERLLVKYARDGYPSASGQPGGSTTVSDPTAQAVLAPDEVRRDRERLAAGLLRIHDQALDLEQIRRRWMTPISEQEMADLKATARCANPVCDELAVKAGRCSACYQHYRLHGTNR